MELTNITKEIYETKQRLNRAASRIFSLADARAKTEMEYRIALRQEILKLESEGQRATLIPDLAKGAQHVAELRFKRDKAKALYDSGRDSMRATETEGSLLQTILRFQSEV